MREPPQKLIAPVMVHDRLRDHRAKPGHAVGKPSRHLAPMQREIGASGSSGHALPFTSRKSNHYSTEPSGD